MISKIYTKDPKQTVSWSNAFIGFTGYLDVDIQAASIPIGCNRLQSVATDREVWCGNGITITHSVSLSPHSNPVRITTSKGSFETQPDNTGEPLHALLVNILWYSILYPPLGFDLLVDAATY